MANENLEAWKTDMNVIRETVRVAKEELERNPELYNKYYKPRGAGHGIGQTVISEFLGGPWKRVYQMRVIKEALSPPIATHWYCNRLVCLTNAVHDILSNEKVKLIATAKRTYLTQLLFLLTGVEKVSIGGRGEMSPASSPGDTKSDVRK
jgi:hypothetical protein